MSSYTLHLKEEGRKIPVGQSHSQIENKLTTLTKKTTNIQIIVQKTQHRKLKTKQHETHQKLGVISGAPEGLADPASHVVD